MDINSKEMDNAIDTYKEMIESLGESGHAWILCQNLGAIFEKRKDYDNAIKYLKKTFSLPEPSLSLFEDKNIDEIPNILLQLSGVYYKKCDQLIDKEKFDEAVSTCKEVFEFVKEDQEILGIYYYNLAMMVGKKTVHFVMENLDPALCKELIDESDRLLQKSASMGCEEAVDALKKIDNGY